MTPAPEIRIALADNHAAFCKSMAERTNGIPGMKVTLDAANGQELLDKLKTTDPKPDVCLINIHMPVLSGYETIVAITKEYPDMHILPVFVYDMEGNVLRMLRAGVRGYLQKNASTAELQRAITDVCNHGFHHPDVTADRMLSALHDGNIGKAALTEDEEQFLALYSTDTTEAEIAEKMSESRKTVHACRRAISAKLGIRWRKALALYAILTGIAGVPARED